MLLIPIQLKIHALKVSDFVPFCANEYEKEKEEKEKMIFRKCHGDLLMTMSDCLLDNILVY